MGLHASSDLVIVFSASVEFPFDASLGGNLLQIFPLPRIHFLVAAEGLRRKSGQVDRLGNVHPGRFFQPEPDFLFADIHGSTSPSLNYIIP